MVHALALCWRELGAEDLDCISRLLEKLTSLQWLSVRTTISPQSFRPALFGANKMRHLSYLSIKSSQLTEDDVVETTVLENMKTLKISPCRYIRPSSCALDQS
jgi:hypothetical protein